MDGDDAMAAIANFLDLSGLPFRAATGTVNISMGGSGGVSVAVTFPVGRFTKAPVVVASASPGSNNYFASTYNATTSGFVMYVSHRDNTGTATSILNSWIANQYLP